MSTLGRYIVDAVFHEDRSPAQLARDHGISRSWIYRLLQRFRERGYQALEPRSRRPHSCAHQVVPTSRLRSCVYAPSCSPPASTAVPRPSTITWLSASSKGPR
jgi:transposase-like protein